MCGILGGNKRTWNYRAGIESMKHRGPDGICIETMQDITFAFARLAIIDLSSNGMQPMFSDDKNVCIVFNGEIYKYENLKKELEKKYCFRSKTDTEVLLYAYMEYGDSFIDKIDGMFAIAIYDRRREKIKLFRDRVGIKPLYYYVQGREFGFSSELKGLINMLGDQKLEIDKTAIYDFLTYIYIPEPKSLYKRIYKLEPGYYLTYDVRKSRIERKGAYWHLKVSTREGKKKNSDTAKYELRKRIKDAVEAQLIADVTVGTLLSGGVDSGIVTFECHRMNAQIGTFSMGFEDPAYDELKYARRLVKEWDLKNYEGRFKRQTYRQLLENMKLWFDEPFADDSAFPTYEVLRLAKKNGVTVLLTGDGGDEVFGGYDVSDVLYKKRGINLRAVSDMYEDVVRNHVMYRSVCDSVCLDGAAFFAWKRHRMMHSEKKRYAELLGIPKDYDDYWFIRKHYHKELPPVTRAQIIDFHTFLPAVLNKVDRTSMALSLEVRVPLLDRDVIEYSFSLPQEVRCPGHMKKELLKRAYPEIPYSIRYRKKQGFSIPYEYISTRGTPCETILHEMWTEVLRK